MPRGCLENSKLAKVFSVFKVKETMKEADRLQGSDVSGNSDNVTKSYESMCGPLPWSFLPIVTGFVPMLGLAITYTVAKTKCHVEKWYFPYVSYTGARLPELMYFGLLFNLEGFFGMMVVFLAWRYYRHLGERSMLNNSTLVVGSVSCFGVIIVGNFPVTYSKGPHYFGAALAFILGTLYTMLTAKLSIRTASLSKVKNINRIKVVRILLAVVMFISLISLCFFSVFKTIHNKYYKKEIVDETELLHPLENGKCPFYPNDTRNIDLFGSLVEWILTIGILICLALYYYEFQVFSSVKVILKQKDGNVFNYVECAEKCEKLQLETQHETDEKSRRSSLADENVVILQLLKKNNLENDEEAMKKVKDFLLNST